MEASAFPFFVLSQSEAFEERARNNKTIVQYVFNEIFTYSAVMTKAKPLLDALKLDDSQSEKEANANIMGVPFKVYF